MADEFRYTSLGSDRIDEIRPLWEALREHHAAMDWPFAAEMGGVLFAGRKQELLHKARGGHFRIEIAAAQPDPNPIAYCLSTVTKDDCGEIDSVFVTPERQRQGIGTELVRRALKWLDQSGAASKRVVVAEGNPAARALYEKLGFLPRTTTMQLPIELWTETASR
jgi:diamine N-acetyltransferase